MSVCCMLTDGLFNHKMMLPAATLVILAVLQNHASRCQESPSARVLTLASTLRQLESVLEKLKGKQLVVFNAGGGLLCGKIVAGADAAEAGGAPPGLPRFVADPKSDKKVICYYDMSGSRLTVSKASALDVVPSNLCTHVVVDGLAELDTSDTAASYIRVSKSENSNKEDDLKTLTASSEVKVLVSLTAHTDPTNKKMSAIVQRPELRAKMVRDALAFVTKYQLSGLEMYWKHPGCWMKICSSGSKDDKANYALLFQELQKVFQPKGLLISCVVSIVMPEIQKGYDLQLIPKFVDWIFVPTFDYTGHWDKKIGHASTILDMKLTLSYFTTIGRVPSKKLVAGLATYGRSFTLADKTKSTKESKITGPGNKGEWSQSAGRLFFFELCQPIKQKKLNVTRNPDSFGVQDDQWVSFDDVINIKNKMKHLNDLSLGGAAVSTLNGDDFAGLCGCGRFPLLRAVNEELRGARLQLPNCT